MFDVWKWNMLSQLEIDNNKMLWQGGARTSGHHAIHHGQSFMVHSKVTARLLGRCLVSGAKAHGTVNIDILALCLAVF